jgi:hypothetical protein
MASRRLQVGLLAGLACLISLPIMAQPSILAAEKPAAGDEPVTKGEFNASIGRLTTAIEKLQTDLTGKHPITREEFNALRDIVMENETILRKEVGQAYAGGAKPVYGPNLRTLMDNPDGRKTLAGAVNDSMPRTGTLHVRNRMASSQVLRVNGNSYQIAALSSLDVSVPTGTVTTELVGYEAPKLAAITPPTYEQEVVIAPTERRYMPIESLPLVSPIVTERYVASPIITERFVASPIITERYVASPIVTEQFVAQPILAPASPIVPWVSWRSSVTDAVVVPRTCGCR